MEIYLLERRRQVYRDRVWNGNVKMNTSPSDANQPEIVIRPFQAGDAADFRRLNEEWIETHFRIEEKDRATLGDPGGAILRPGGQIFMAAAGGEAVGCVALLPLADGGYEVAKMAVSPHCRGRGIGRLLLEAAVSWARGRQAPRLYLESNAALTPALRLYESVGFRHLPPGDEPLSPYARANVFMEMRLDS